MNNEAMTNEEAADLLEKHLDFFAGTTQWVFTLAIAALRTPPATGAAAMREAAAKACEKIGEPYMPREADICRSCAAAIRALPFPAPEVPDKYAAFGKAVWLALSDRIGHGEMDETDADNAELAVKAGLAEHVHYDPEKHGDVQDAAPGDKIVWWGGL